MLLVFLFMATIPVILFIKSDRGRKTKLWNIKYDNDEEEDITIKQLIDCQKLYSKQKQYYDTESNKKLFNTSNNGGREETTEEDGC
jgi:hypothetical protein